MKEEIGDNNLIGKYPTREKVQEWREATDIQRNNYLYLMGDLMELNGWLENGYKDCEGKTEAMRLISNEIDKLRKEADKLLKALFPNIKQLHPQIQKEMQVG